MKILSKQQKISLAGLIVLTIAIIVTAFIQFRITIYKPFNISSKQEGGQETSQLFNLQAIDTDNDGLSDLDETSVYKTSPYLEDTDGDGISDKKEVDQGANPNCAAGKDCSIKLLETTDNSGTAKENELSSEEIKALLLKSGVKQETLDQIDDKVLRELYNETIKETGVDPANLPVGENKSELPSSINPAAQNAPLTAEQKKTLENLSIEQIREYLLSTGMDKATLDQIDDLTLQAIFSQALNQE